MITINACPVCGGREATRVCAYNGLILIADVQSSDLARYDYSCCHQCGLVFATRRPAGEEFVYLSRHFNEFLGRASGEDANPLDNERPLTDADRRALQRAFAGGWLASEHLASISSDWMPWVLADRMSQGYHFDWLSASVPLAGRRVLEVRSKTGFLLDLLRRYHGARVFAMPMFESQQFVIEQLYGIPCERRVDFEHFEIPYDGQFDLIITKHLFTHAIHPEAAFQTLRERLAPGGFLYLYAESDDSFKYLKGKNLFGEQKCFHFQNFDLQTFVRCLNWQGFRVVFIRHPKRGDSEMTCLAQADPVVKAALIQTPDLTRRIAMYEAWHDGSVLHLPSYVQQIMPREVETAQTRERQRAERPNAAEERPPKPFKMMHDDGYRAVNEQRRRRPTPSGSTA
jgi:SAM-dependent methyltransferase